jgi:predicted GIY-YIG superfamily endonuclease
MRYPASFWSISAFVTARLRLILTAVIAAAIASLASVGEAVSMDQTTPAEETTVTPDLELPLDALGYLGGLFEARFYEPHSTTDEPRDEIQEAASLYGLDLAMMMSIAKVESDFDPRVRTGSYKGLFQLSDYEFQKYGDGSIWDARDNARAAAHMFLVQAEKFRWALGHYPDYAERYMVHQQGIQGAIEHYTHPERVAWQSMCATDEGVLKGEQWCKRCIWGNLLPQWKDAFGSVDKISSGEFVSLWTERINHLANRYSVAEAPVSVSRPAKNRAHHPIAVGHSKLRAHAPHARRVHVALVGIHR